MSVTIIIPCFRHDFAKLEQGVERILSQRNQALSCELILVDNHPVATLAPCFKKRDDLRILHEPKPGSYAARNAGIRQAQGDVVVFTDADCLPTRDWLREGLEALRNQPDKIGVAGAVRFLYRRQSAPNTWELLDSVLHIQQELYVKDNHFGATANLFVRRNAFETVGLFREDLMSGGDREWGERAFCLGRQLGYAERAIVLHPARWSWTDLLKKTQRIAGGELAARERLVGLGLAIREAWRGGRWRFRMIRRNKGRFKGGQLYLAFLGVIALEVVRLLETQRLRGGGNPVR